MRRIETEFKGRIAEEPVSRLHAARQNRRLMYAGFCTALWLACAAPLLGQDFNALINRPFISATGTPYLADPTGKVDATNAIQSCINDTVAKRAACVLPAGIYTISGSGLTMPNQSSLYGFQNLGDASASIVYYGTETAVTIGNCSDTSSLVYGVNLVNVSINQASGTQAEYGIQACGLSEANWDGLSVGNSSTTGYFTGANIRFYDSAEIDLLNLTMGNPGYQPGTTGILFDDFGKWGNATITIHGAASGIFAFQNALVCKSCINIAVRDTLIEGNDYGLFVDNSTWNSPSDALDNVNFESTEFLMNDIAGPTHSKVLQVNSPAGAKLVVKNLVFRSTKWQLNGKSGVTFPVELNIPSVGQYSVFSLKLDTNSVTGANTAVVDSNNSLASIFFTGENDITDPNGIKRPPDLHGTATVFDYMTLFR